MEKGVGIRRFRFCLDDGGGDSCLLCYRFFVVLLILLGFLVLVFKFLVVLFSSFSLIFYRGVIISFFRCLGFILYFFRLSFF